MPYEPRGLRKRSDPIHSILRAKKMQISEKQTTSPTGAHIYRKRKLAAVRNARRVLKQQGGIDKRIIAEKTTLKPVEAMTPFQKFPTNNMQDLIEIYRTMNLGVKESIYRRLIKERNRLSKTSNVDQLREVLFEIRAIEETLPERLRTKILEEMK